MGISRTRSSGTHSALEAGSRAQSVSPCFNVRRILGSVETLAPGGGEHIGVSVCMCAYVQARAHTFMHICVRVCSSVHMWGTWACVLCTCMHTPACQRHMPALAHVY